jgi:predicted nuclease with TOPRIM domain
MQINQMMIENDKLSANVKKLSGNVDDLEKVEGELSKIVDGNSIDHLVDVVKETKEINEKIKVRKERSVTGMHLN